MTVQTRALFVHLLTATGAVFAMLALLAAVQEKWSIMFLWLVVAFAVDGIDGPLARKYDVKANAPRFDGVLLDLIIDYLTYVFIPAFALFQSGLLPGWTGWVAIILITFASALYFADNRMKTEDNSFHGFPGCWNMLVLVMFALTPNFWIILALVAALAVAMFLPLKFVHPVRTERWRGLTLPLALAWTFFAGWAAWVDFHPQSWAHWGLIVTSVYLVGAGILQQIVPLHPGPGGQADDDTIPTVDMDPPVSIDIARLPDPNGSASVRSLNAHLLALFEWIIVRAATADVTLKVEMTYVHDLGPGLDVKTPVLLVPPTMLSRAAAEGGAAVGDFAETLAAGWQDWTAQNGLDDAPLADNAHLVFDIQRFQPGGTIGQMLPVGQIEATLSLSQVTAAPAH